MKLKKFATNSVLIFKIHNSKKMKINHISTILNKQNIDNFIPNRLQGICTLRFNQVNTKNQ